jgi:hypothetical protein
MSLDSRTYPCFHTDCSFQGTQNQLDRHQKNECHFRLTRCAHCHVFFQWSRSEDHKKTCRGCVSCEFCVKYIVKSHFDEHLLNVHQKVMCSDCKDICEKEDIENHKTSQCCMRKVSCCVCRNDVCFCDMKTHSYTHFYETVACLDRANTVIREKTQVLHQLRELLETLS